MSWVTFDSDTGNLTITPPAFNQDQNMIVYFKSTMTYRIADINYSDESALKLIYIYINAAGWQVDNCETCQTLDYSTCLECSTGYNMSSQASVSSSNVKTTNSCVQNSPQQTNSTDNTTGNW